MSEIKAYDFKSNILLQPDDLKIIKGICENFAEITLFSFGGTIKKEFSVSYSGAVLNRFGQLTRNIRMPVMMGRMSIEGLTGDVFIQADPAVRYGLIEFFLGGDYNKPINDKEVITEIEERLIKRIFERLMRNFEKAMPSSLNCSFTSGEIVKKSEDFESGAVEELIASLNFELKIQEVAGNLMIGLPYFLLEPIFKRTKKKAEKRDIEKNKEDIIKLGLARLMPMYVDVTVILSNNNIKLKDLLDIRVGDCISLEHDINKPLLVELGGKPKFYGMPGLIGKKMAVKIIQEVKGKGGDKNG